jgi:hypothetical protein
LILHRVRGSGWPLWGQAAQASRRWAGLLAGINKPRTGSVTVGEVELTELPLPVLRTEVALVTQEHHVFVGTGTRQHHLGARIISRRCGHRGAANR